MARSVRRAWNDGKGGGSEDDLLKRARENVTEKQEAARQNLAKLQGLEIKQLEGERTWIAREQARDVSAINDKEIAGINQRYDRQQHELARRHKSFLGKMLRLIGGHGRQQRQLKALNAGRDREVGDRTQQHVLREGQRQRALSERDVRVEKDLQEARQKHSDARETQRQQQEQGFDFSVKQEVNRLRKIQKPEMRP